MSRQPVSRLSLDQWRQFKGAGVHLDFDSSTTILAGLNGTGKTTILNVLATSLGVRTPQFASSLDDQGGFRSGLDSSVEESSQAEEVAEEVVVDGRKYHINANLKQIGSVKVEEIERPILAPRSVKAGYKLQVLGANGNIGVGYFPAHRQPFEPTEVPSLPTKAVDAKTMLSEYQTKEMQSLNQTGRGVGLAEMKQALILLALFGPGNSNIQPNPDLQRLFAGFEDRLSIALPKEYGFKQINVRFPHVTVVSRYGEYPIDALSGGLSSLFATIWKLHLLSEYDPKGIALMDEPENHLHPSAQREFLPAISRAFPDLQKIVVTHNPFVLSSIKEASVYMMSFEEDQSVVAERVNLWDRSGSMDDVLLKTFGLTVPSAPWVEDELTRVQEMLVDSSKSLQERTKDALEALQKIGMLDMASRLLPRIGDGAEETN